MAAVANNDEPHFERRRNALEQEKGPNKLLFTKTISSGSVESEIFDEENHDRTSEHHDRTENAHEWPVALVSEELAGPVEQAGSMSILFVWFR
jgi:hypothetical protein